MAKMLPEVDPSAIQNRGESLAYPLLRDQLPDDWVVIYDYKFCVRVERSLKEGQVDFIVIAPKKGVLFIEVKGSHGLRLDPSNEKLGFRVKQNGTEEPLGKTPFTQVDEHKHNIVGQILCQRLGVSKNQFPGIYAHAVFYPQGQLVNTPPSQDIQVFWGYGDQENLYQRVLAAFKNVAPLRYGERFDAGTMAKIVELFCDQSFIPIAQAAESDEFNGQIRKLTKNQFNIIQGFLRSDAKRVLVEGQAGSGKTMLALWTAEHFAAIGMRTLFLCKNNALRNWIKIRQPNAAFNVHTFQGLCPKLDKNWDRHNKFEQGFWEESVSSIIADAADALPSEKRYDAIVIDEGQDFQPNWFIPIELLFKDENNARLFVFFDPEQQIQFDGDLSFPDMDIRYPLIANCRNPEKINDYCGKVINKDLKSMEGMPEGRPPTIKEAVADSKRRSDLCVEQIKKWHSEGFKPSRIAVLSPYNSNNKNSSLFHLKSKSILNLSFSDDTTQINEWTNNQVFWMSTITAFKGLEADCVVLTDIPSPNSFFSENDFYVGTSRAKHQVVVIPCDTKTQVRARGYLDSK
ncbi:MAG: NERD domain-containing protein [Rubripirellula sp.]